MWADVWRKLKADPTSIAAGVLVALLVLTAIAAPLLSQYDPRATSPDRFAGPSGEHWLGTDNLGRDLFSRVTHGSRITLSLSLLAMGLGLLTGVSLGLMAGYFRFLDEPIMRLMDILLAFPYLIRAIAIVAALGPGLYQVVIAVGIGGIPIFSRYTRSYVLSLKEKEFVEAAWAAGAGNFHIIARHIIPNCVGPIVVYGTIQLSQAIQSIAILGFLGMGVQPPTPEWGAMVSEARSFFMLAPNLVIVPSVAIFLAVLGFNLLGDSLQDALDPRIK